MEEARLKPTLNTTEVEKDSSYAHVDPTDHKYLKNVEETARKLLKSLNALNGQLETNHTILKLKIQANKDVVYSILNHEEMKSETKVQQNCEKYHVNFVKQREWFLNANDKMLLLNGEIVKAQKGIKTTNINVLDNKPNRYLDFDEDTSSHEDDKSDADNNSSEGDDSYSEYTGDFDNVRDSGQLVKNEHESLPNGIKITTDEKLQSVIISSDEVNEADVFRSGRTTAPVLVPHVHSTEIPRKKDSPFQYDVTAEPIGESQPRRATSSTKYNSKMVALKPSVNRLPIRIEALEGRVMKQPPQIEQMQAKSIDVQSVHQLIKQSENKFLPDREETVMHLKNDKSATENAHVNKDTAVTRVECQRHDVPHTNWIDAKLFTNYYLVITQKTVASSSNTEYLNKYYNESGKIIAWLWLPGAGRMCKIGEDGRVGVLQIDQKARSISVVQTSKHKFNANEHQLRKIYHINIQQAYTAICHLEILHPQGSDDSDQLKFAAVYSAERKGEIKEEIDIINSVVNVRSFGLPKTGVTTPGIARFGGICGIDALEKNTIVVSLHSHNIICLDTKGRVIWNIEVNARVTDICCTKEFVFACIYDKKQIMQIQVCGNSWKIVNNNIIQNENIHPSQVSVCGRQVLVREFIMDEFKSQIILRDLKIHS